MAVTAKELLKLEYPFLPNEIFWRPISTTDTQALLIPYVKARACRARLNEVCGASQWRLSFFPGPAGGVICRLEINCAGDEIGSEWVWKDDGAANPSADKLSWSADPEDISIKGGLSNAFKRAAKSWGIAVYLDYAPKVWRDWDFQNKAVRGPLPRLPSREQTQTLHAMGVEIYGKDHWNYERSECAFAITRGEERSLHGLEFSMAVRLEKILHLRLMLLELYHNTPENWRDKELEIIHGFTEQATTNIYLLGDEQLAHLLGAVSRQINSTRNKPALSNEEIQQKTRQGQAEVLRPEDT